MPEVSSFFWNVVCQFFCGQQKRLHDQDHHQGSCSDWESLAGDRGAPGSRREGGWILHAPIIAAGWQRVEFLKRVSPPPRTWQAILGNLPATDRVTFLRYILASAATVGIY